MSDFNGNTVTPEWLESMRSRLSLLLAEAELRFGENEFGTYPSEIEMTLRIATSTAARAVRQALEPRPEPIASEEQV